MIRRGTAYGPELPEGVLADDGVDRGLMFAFVGTQLGRQFEFVQSEWVNGGDFLGLGDIKDPIAGGHAPDRPGSFSIPQRPIPRRLHGLARFVVTRGGSTASCPDFVPCAGWQIHGGRRAALAVSRTNRHGPWTFGRAPWSAPVPRRTGSTAQFSR